MIEVLIAYASRERPGEPAHSGSLARAFTDCTEKKTRRWRVRHNCLYHFMWFRYLLHMRAGKDQASLHIQAVSPEPSLIALKRRHVDEGSGIIVYTISCDRGTYCICEQGKTRRACTFRQSLPEPSLIALKRRHVDEGSGIIVYTISCDLGTYCICEQGKTRRACTFAQSCLSVRWLH